MKKRILIFGGGENQLTLIEAARSLGVESVVVDPDASAPGKRIADHFEVVGPMDYDLTRLVARKYKVDGIVTGQMENPLALMARLAEENGYIFPSPDVILNCRNKYLMKQVFLKNGIPCARGIKIEAGEALTPEKLKDFSFPIIIKPVDSFSSRGVYRINDFNEIAGFEETTKSFSSDKSIIVEELIEGKEYSVESLTYNGYTSVIQFTEKIITSYPYTVEMGHLQPADLSSEDKEAISTLVIKAINALGIENSAAHTELKLTSAGPVIIEIGARLGGDFISSYLTLASTGISMDQGAINIALGFKPDNVCKSGGFSFIRYLEFPAGVKVLKVNDWLSIRKLPNVVFASLNIKEGQLIPCITDSAKRPGFVIVKGNTREEVLFQCNEKIRLLKNAIQTSCNKAYC